MAASPLAARGIYSAPMSEDDDRTASLMTPAKLAQLKVRPAAAASPAAWLDQMAADAGSGHVRRLVDLRRQLVVQLGEDATAGVTAAGAALRDAVGAVDLGLAQPKGWLARATGKGKEAAATFLAQAERAGHAADELADEARGLPRKLQAQATPLDRSVLEMEVELRAIEKIMDQGARWLQDMRNQLKARESAGGDDAVQQQIREDSARCELLVARLKLLRGVSAAGQQALEQCQALPARRNALSDSVQKVLDGQLERWRKKLAPLVEQAAAAGGASEGVDRAQDAREALQRALQQLAQDGEALRRQQQAAVDALAAAEAPLEAAF